MDKDFDDSDDGLDNSGVDGDDNSNFDGGNNGNDSDNSNDGNNINDDDKNGNIKKCKEVIMTMMMSSCIICNLQLLDYLVTYRLFLFLNLSLTDNSRELLLLSNLYFLITDILYYRSHGRFISYDASKQLGYDEI